MGFVTETRAHIHTCLNAVNATQDCSALEHHYTDLIDLRTRIFQHRVLHMDLLDAVNDALQTTQTRTEMLRALRQSAPRTPCTPLCLRATSAVSGAFLLVVYIYSVLRYYGTL